jgi:hypothetical protein
MRNFDEGIAKLMDELLQNPEKIIKKKSRSFWKSFEIKKRVEPTISRLKETLLIRGITIELSQGEFGTETLDSTLITLKYYPIISPDDVWFESMANKEYESEMEVQAFFVKPLFTALGYEEVDFSFDATIRFPDPKTRNSVKGKRPDLVLYDRTLQGQDKALIIIEAKKLVKNPRKQTEALKAAISNAKVYWSILDSKFCVATDGDILIVFDPTKRLLNSDLKVHRSQFKERWPELYLLISKQVLV